mgnify:CR=1 FL=1|jgi:hypothetical protein
MKTISFAVTVCNEILELTKLLNFLQNTIREEDEIVIQYDEQSVTQDVLEYLDIMKKMHGYTIVGFPLNKDFATYKNNLTKHCTKDYIFQLDADEIPHENLVRWLSDVLDDNPVDVIFVPRVNTVEGLTQEHIQKWRWSVNEKGWVNFPDYQLRIYRRTDDVMWMKPVHETITGYNTFSNFPAEEEWSLYHPKDIDRQTRQNEFYETI